MLRTWAFVARVAKLSGAVKSKSGLDQTRTAVARFGHARVIVAGGRGQFRTESDEHHRVVEDITWLAGRLRVVRIVNVLMHILMQRRAA